MADPVYTWIPNTTRAVATNGYYRFPVVVPGTTTDDALFKLLEAKSWEVKSLGVPPPELSEAVMRVAMTGLQAPKAFWVHATWRGSAATIPAIDGAIYYGPLETLVEEKPQTPDNKPNDSGIGVYGFIFGTVLVGSVAWLIYNRHKI